MVPAGLSQRDGHPSSGVSSDFQSPSLITTCWSGAAAKELEVPTCAQPRRSLLSPAASEVPWTLSPVGLGRDR